MPSGLIYSLYITKIFFRKCIVVPKKPHPVSRKWKKADIFFGTLQKIKIESRAWPCSRELFTVAFSRKFFFRKWIVLPKTPHPVSRKLKKRYFFRPLKKWNSKIRLSHALGPFFRVSISQKKFLQCIVLPKTPHPVSRVFKYKHFFTTTLKNRNLKIGLSHALGTY